MNATSAQQLWSKLAGAGLTVGDMPEAQENHAPWYVRVMLGIAGLMAAAFLLGFVGAGFAFVMESKKASLVVGSMMIAAAYFVFRVAPRSDFGSMFALAVSFAGQVLVIFGVWEFFDARTRGTPWAAIAIIEAVLAIGMPNFIHRVVSAYGAALALVFAFASPGAQGIIVGIVAAAIALVWLNEVRFAKLHAVVTPVGYGLTLAFIQLESTDFLGHFAMRMFGSQADTWARPWIGEALVAAALLFVVGSLLLRAGWSMRQSRTILSLAAATAIGAVSLKAPGVAGGLTIVLVGFANGNRVLAGLGIAALLFYVSSYYYLLEATLLTKAGVLASSGAVLLAARWLLLSVVMPQKAPDA